MSEGGSGPPSLSSETQLPIVHDGNRNPAIYKPLPAGEFIRVLKLQPGDTEHDIECSLELVDIETSKGSYEAISYVWGDPNDTVDVQGNGVRVSITVSLADALRNFRHTSEPRVLWADALCINQAHKQEKGHQVKRMGEVYANAKRTLVWLGCDDQNVANDTFALICEVNAYFGDSLLKANQIYVKMAPFTEPYPISVDKERWLGVVRLFNFLWFSRVWTVQEVAIAEECRVFWGSASINIADVMEICVWLTVKKDFGAAIQSIIGHVIGITTRQNHLYSYYNHHRPKPWQQSRPGLTTLATATKANMFLMVLHAAHSLKASDPRDHVYAFLGCPFAKDGEGRTPLDVDYTSSIDDLHILLASALMKNLVEGSFVLSYVHHDCRDSL